MPHYYNPGFLFLFFLSHRRVVADSSLLILDREIRAKVMQFATTAFVVVLLGGAANALDWTDFKSCTAECVAVSWYTHMQSAVFF